MATSQKSSKSAMEVILLQDISGLGKKNDVLMVKDGFALNYLFPQRVALAATPTVRKRYAEQIRKRALERETERKLLTDAAQLIAGKTITLRYKVAKGGRLYAGVGSAEIRKAIMEQFGLDVSQHAIDLEEPIKSIGTFQVPLRVAGGSVMLAVDVLAETGTKKVGSVRAS